jgi:uncharacterized protein (DUF1499 family)
MGSMRAVLGGSSVPVLIGCAGALAAAGAAALAGLGHRWGWWGFREGFTILRWAAWGGLAAAALCLAGAALARSGAHRTVLPLALAGAVAGGCVFFVPWRQSRIARQVPAIHDISTDTDTPPLFAAILPLRAAAANPAAYGGPEVARLQRAAYPDIAPLRLAVSPPAAFERALAAARRLGWTVVAQDPAAGRIEAFDRTFWFGFFDDVVVRVAPDGAGSRVDVRSVSRVGRSDVGANARRIRAYLRALAAGR